ncbi:methionine--tRNA ligase [bacterium]|nr:methionine--tRNA ligase [bacterium]
MTDKQACYITTTLPYVNAKPHIGFAAEITRADTFARYQKLMGKVVFFNTGTDEHGQKIYDNAVEAGQTPQEYVDKFAAEFKGLIPALGISEDIHFIRTTDAHHKEAAQEMWRRCNNNGDIYKATQTIRYCVGCELEKTDSELEEGKCPLHPNKDLEVREEENYFFRFSKYQEPLLELYREKSNFVIPAFRQKEIQLFVEDGLQDFSVSRLKSKMPWGVPVPNDDDHVMFVWFDALTNYISTTGWPEEENFGGWWPGIQFAGKDNLRQQTAIWQAMLMSANLPTSQTVMIGGFINSGGQKMSKSLGNVIDPFEVKERYGLEAMRYFLLRHVHPFEDTDVTWEKMDEWYTANLVNGLGNLTARIMKMAETHLDKPIEKPGRIEFPTEYTNALDEFNFQGACDHIWRRVGELDEKITTTEPFKLVKEDPEKAKEIIKELAEELYFTARLLYPIMPQTNKVIKEAVLENKKPANLFNRLPE